MTDFDQKIFSSQNFVEKRKEIQNAKTVDIISNFIIYMNLMYVACLEGKEERVGNWIGRISHFKEKVNKKHKVNFDELRVFFPLKIYLFLSGRFIGELFKVGSIVSIESLNFCIRRLSRQTESEESLECLCILLSTVGKEIEYRVEMKITKAKSVDFSFQQFFIYFLPNFWDSDAGEYE